MQIKKNDTVVVTTGKEKGKRGRVIAVYPRENRLLIEKLNMIKRQMYGRAKFDLLRKRVLLS